MKTGSSRFLLVACCAGCLGLAAVETEVWRLGKADGSSKDCVYLYHVWDYGRAPWLATHPAMDGATGTWKVTVEGSSDRLPLPEEIGTPAWNAQMPNGEVVTGVTFSWNEKAPGMRRLTCSFSGVRNVFRCRDRALELTVAGFGAKFFTIPSGEIRKPGQPAWTVSGVFPVKAGRNEATLRITAVSKGLALSFDAVELRAVEGSSDFAPVLAARPAGDTSGVYVFGAEPPKVVFRLHNRSDADVAYTVVDHRTNVVARGTAQIRDGRGEVVLPAAAKGWYGVTAEAAGDRVRTAYAVVEKPDPAPKPHSRFGCFAVCSDWGRIIDSPFSLERFALKIARARLGGAKRVHYEDFHWSEIEPVRGEFNWKDVDQTLRLARENGWPLLVNVTDVPDWNTPSKDTKLTCVGRYARRYYPPVDMDAWRTFVTRLVERCRGKTIGPLELEVGAEISFNSHGWTTGDPKAYGEYLAVCYEAAKAADPTVRISPGAPLSADFLRAALESLKGRRCFDTLAQHYLEGTSRLSSKIEPFRAVAKAYGYPETAANTEDMCWSPRHTENEEAALLVKNHVRDAARGLTCTYMFHLFDKWDGACVFDAADDPRVAFAAYRAMTHRLEDAAYVGELSSIETEIHVFDRGGVPVIVCWSELPVASPFELDLGVGEVLCVDEMDNARTVRTAGGVLKAEAADLVCYFEGGDWMRIRALLAAHPKDVFAARSVNPAGKNLAVDAKKPRSWGFRDFFTAVDSAPVGYGERYVVSAEIRGTGCIDAMVVLRDKAGERVYPSRNGLNFFNFSAEKEWRRVSQVFDVRDPAAATLHVLMCASYWEKYRDCTLDIRNLVVARVSPTCSETKAVCRGRTGAPLDLGGGWTATLAYDDRNLRLTVAGGRAEEIAFALDPRNEAADMSLFTASFRGAQAGRVVKRRHYVTPEVRRDNPPGGIMPGATATGDDRRAEIVLPMAVAYPLVGGEKALGFAVSVRTADGAVRLFAQDLFGKSPDPSNLGHLDN